MNITATNLSVDGKIVGIFDFVQSFQDEIPEMELHAHMHDMGPYLIDENLRRELEEFVEDGSCELDHFPSFAGLVI